MKRELKEGNKMVLEKKVYKMLESVVGPENISDDPIITTVYSYQYLADLANPDSAKWMPAKPEAVILPGSTEEIQEIVRICNKHNVKIKPHSTGWGFWSGIVTSGVIQMDLRRMNRIIEIDEKNMYAVVEPYVTAMQLQIEAMKRGLDCAIIGAGPNHSVLASCTAMMGYGDKGYHTSMNNRNLLGVEWVTPTGEVLRLGSLGSGAGWFCGDGPGPSLRGLLRGWHGTMGGLGIFTKCATKLYPWAGPKKPEIMGENPQYGMVVPENFKIYTIYWENWEQQADAMYKVSESEIGYIIWRACTPMMIPLLLGKTNNEYYEMMKGIYDMIEAYRYYFTVVLASESKRELEYQEKVLKSIVDETNGKFFEFILSENAPLILLAIVTQCYNSRIFRPTGQFHTSFGAATSWDMSVKGAKIGEQIRRKYIEEEVFHDDGCGENFWGGPYEHNKFSHFEGLFEYDPIDPESRKAARKYIEEATMAVIENKIGVPIGPGPELAQIFGPIYGNFHSWLGKIKKSFDPKNVSDHAFYAAPEEKTKD